MTRILIQPNTFCCSEYLKWFVYLYHFSLARTESESCSFAGHSFTATHAASLNIQTAYIYTYHLSFPAIWISQSDCSVLCFRSTEHSDRTISQSDCSVLLFRTHELICTWMLEPVTIASLVGSKTVQESRTERQNQEQQRMQTSPKDFISLKSYVSFTRRTMPPFYSAKKSLLHSDLTLGVKECSLRTM